MDCLTDNDNACLVSFESNAYLKARLGATKETLHTAINSLNAYGGTYVSSGLNMALNQLIASTSGNQKAIVLICDGDVDSVQSYVNIAKANNIKIFAINVISADNDILQSMADETGGEYYYAYTAEELLTAFSHISSESLFNFDLTDTDGDGLPDTFEKNGMRLANGKIVYTDPNKPDTDGDGFTDGEEMGILRVLKDFDFSLANIPIFSLPYKKYYYGNGQYSTSTIFFDIKCNPTLKDTDFDTFDDFDDLDPLSFDAEKGLMFQSNIRIGLDQDNINLAPDLTYNDYNEDKLYKLNSLFENQAKLSESELKTDFLNLASMFTLTGNGKALFDEQYNSFINGTNSTVEIKGESKTYTVSCFYSDLLTDTIKRDKVTQDYIDFVVLSLKDELQNNNGDIIKSKNNTNIIIENNSYELIYPYNKPWYLFNGLTICVDNVWGHNITIKDYFLDGNHYSGTLHFKLYDNFGLDPGDVSGMYGNLAGFRAWYCLQHQTKYNGKYKPFINIMEFDIDFSGELQ